ARRGLRRHPRDGLLDFYAGATRILRHAKPATPLLDAAVRARGGVAARAVQRIRHRRRSELLPVFHHPALRLVQPGADHYRMRFGLWVRAPAAAREILGDLVAPLSGQLLGGRGPPAARGRRAADRERDIAPMTSATAHALL